MKKKRGLREYLILDESVTQGTGEAEAIQHLLKRIPTCELDFEDLRPTARADAISIFQTALVGDARGWRTSALKKRQALRFIETFLSFFEPGVRIYCNTDGQSWTPFYDSGWFIFSDGIVVLGPERVGLFVVQEND